MRLSPGDATRGPQKFGRPGPFDGRSTTRTNGPQTADLEAIDDELRIRVNRDRDLKETTPTGIRPRQNEDDDLIVQEYEVRDILNRYDRLARASAPVDAFAGQPAVVIPGLLYYQGDGRGIQPGQIASDPAIFATPSFSRFQSGDR